jgi:hypothetical protein
MEKFMDPLATLMKNLGNPEVTTELKQTIVEGVMQEAGNRSVKQNSRRKKQDVTPTYKSAYLRRCRSTSAKKGHQT